MLSLLFLTLSNISALYVAKLDLGLPSRLLKLLEIITIGLFMHFKVLPSYCCHALQRTHLFVDTSNRGNG